MPSGVPGLDVGQRGGVAAQCVRQDLGLGGPRLAAPVAGERAGDQAGDGHDVPLQALGLVGGEHLDGVLAAGQRVVEALLVLRGGAQEAEEGQQASPRRRGRRSAAAMSRKLRQGLAAAGGQGVRGRGQLDLQAGDGEHPVQDVHQRVGQRAAQVAQLGGEPGEAHARVRRRRAARRRRRRRSASPGRCPARRRARSPRPGRRPRRPRRAAGPGRRRRPRARADTSSRARRPSSARSRGPMRQRGPVSSRTSEALAPGSWRTSQTATRSATSGRCSSPESPTTSTGTSRATSAPWISAKSVGGAAQDGDLAGRRAGAYEVGDGVGEPVDLLGVGVQQGAAHHAVALGAGRGAQRLHALVHGAQGLGEAVGEVEEAAAAAAVLAERLSGRRGCRRRAGSARGSRRGWRRRRRASRRSPGRGRRRRSPAWPVPLAEQAGQQDALGHRGVLVLVEQDDPELVAQDAADLGPGAGERGGEGDLVAEVEEVALALGGAVAGRPVRASSRRAAAVSGTLRRSALVSLALSRARSSSVSYARSSSGRTRCSESSASSVSRSLTRSGKERGERRVGAGGLAQHARGELVAGGVGEEPGGGFEADAQAVVGQEAAGEGVIGGDDAVRPAGCPGR